MTSSPALSIQYDGGTPTAGNVTNDGTTQYTYDAEGRVCALHGPQGMIGYQYDADGTRIGKGSVTNWQSCDLTSNGYQPMTDFILDQGGAQMTEVAVTYSPSGSTFNWTHTNVMADGMLVATYDTTGTGLHFYLNDALGTRRAQTDPGGFPEQTCQSLPFGDQLYCTGSLTSPTEHHFTGKERDQESGLDYFGARYYASNMGRFMSPDWSAKEEPVPYSSLDIPQSLNLYGYVLNNPLSKADADGHWPNCTCRPDLGHLLYHAVTTYNYSQAAKTLGSVIKDDAHTIGTVLTKSWDNTKDFALTHPLPVLSSMDPIPQQSPEAEPKRGQPPQLQAGKDAHDNEEVRPGEKAEVPTADRKGRMDRYNEEESHIREIKPDNARGRRAGEKQLERYKATQEEATQKPHTTELTLYPPK